MPACPGLAWTAITRTITHERVPASNAHLAPVGSLSSGGGSSSHVRFGSPEPAEPDSGLSSIEDGSLGRSPGDTPRAHKHKKRRRDREPTADAETLEAEATQEPEEPAQRRSKKRRREDEERPEEQQQTPSQKAKKSRRSEPSPPPVVVKQELYLADPELPSASHKKRKRRKEQAELNGSISGTIR